MILLRKSDLEGAEEGKCRKRPGISKIDWQTERQEGASGKEGLWQEVQKGVRNGSREMGREGVIGEEMKESARGFRTNWQFGEAESPKQHKSENDFSPKVCEQELV